MLHSSNSAKSSIGGYCCNSSGSIRILLVVNNTSSNRSSINSISDGCR